MIKLNHAPDESLVVILAAFTHGGELKPIPAHVVMSGLDRAVRQELKKLPPLERTQWLSAAEKEWAARHGRPGLVGDEYHLPRYREAARQLP